MPRTRDDRDNLALRNNVLPFPSLQHAPRDVRPVSIGRVLGTLLAMAVIVGSLGLTLWSLFM